MPCRDYSEWDHDTEIQNRLDRATRLLCSLCRRIEDLGKENEFIGRNTELHLWWHEHKELDRLAEAHKAEVKRKNNLKRNALAKLTTEERDALGIK